MQRGCSLSNLFVESDSWECSTLDDITLKIPSSGSFFTVALLVPNCCVELVSMNASQQRPTLFLNDGIAYVSSNASSRLMRAGDCIEFKEDIVVALTASTDSELFLFNVKIQNH